MRSDTPISTVVVMPAGAMPMAKGASLKEAQVMSNQQDSFRSRFPLPDPGEHLTDGDVMINLGQGDYRRDVRPIRWRDLAPNLWALATVACVIAACVLVALAIGGA